MPWWGYVLIGVGVVLIGFLKIKVFDHLMKKRKPKVVHKDEIED